ncbi:MAG: hypothetical protein J6Q13_02165 [Clostridia bacterium]|nr:hypothetical protein [Clostridia bacterium]
MEFKVDLNVSNFADVENLIVTLVFETEKAFTLDDILNLAIKYLESYNIAYSKVKLAKSINEKLDLLQQNDYVSCSNGKYKTISNNEKTNLTLSNEEKTDLRI